MASPLNYSCFSPNLSQASQYSTSLALSANCEVLFGIPAGAHNANFDVPLYNSVGGTEDYADYSIGLGRLASHYWIAPPTVTSYTFQLLNVTNMRFWAGGWFGLTNVNLGYTAGIRTKNQQQVTGLQPSRASLTGVKAGELVISVMALSQSSLTVGATRSGSGANQTFMWQGVNQEYTNSNGSRHWVASYEIPTSDGTVTHTHTWSQEMTGAAFMWAFASRAGSQVMVIG